MMKHKQIKMGKLLLQVWCPLQKQNQKRQRYHLPSCVQRNCEIQTESGIVFCTCGIIQKILLTGLHHQDPNQKTVRSPPCWEIPNAGILGLHGRLILINQTQKTVTEI